MKNISLQSGNIAIINSIRYAYNKCIVTFSITNGYWTSAHNETFNIDYYQSPEDYIISNY